MGTCVVNLAEKKIYFIIEEIANIRNHAEALRCTLKIAGCVALCMDRLIVYEYK